jgi:hypothetical protein
MDVVEILSRQEGKTLEFKDSFRPHGLAVSRILGAEARIKECFPKETRMPHLPRSDYFGDLII